MGVRREFRPSRRYRSCSDATAATAERSYSLEREASSTRCRRSGGRPHGYLRVAAPEVRELRLHERARVDAGLEPRRTNQDALTVRPPVRSFLLARRGRMPHGRFRPVQSRLRTPRGTPHLLVPNNAKACGATGIAVGDGVLSDAPDAENTSTPIVTGHVGVGASEEGRNRAIVDHARDGEERRERRRSVRGLGHREGEYGSSCDHCAQHGLILLHDFRSWGAPVRAPWSHRSAPSPLGLGESAGPRDVPSVLRAACFRILAQRRYKSCSNARRSTPTTSVPGRSGDGRTARRYAPRW